MINKNNWIDKFLKCPIFAEYEDEVGQKITVIGLLLRRIKKSADNPEIREKCNLGIEYCIQVENILKYIRQKIEDDNCQYKKEFRDNKG